jgi:hypothetical protein
MSTYLELPGRFATAQDATEKKKLELERFSAVCFTGGACWILVTVPQCEAALHAGDHRLHSLQQALSNQPVA